VLRQRMAGHAPSPDEGVPRESNFIERVLAAMDQDRLALMTLRDAEEMMVLAFECISGRTIPVLGFHYRGRWRLAPRLDRVEAARNQYRIAQAKVYSRLRALSDRLSDAPGLVPHSGAEETFESCIAQLHDLAAEMNAGLRRISDSHSMKPRELRARVADMRVALELADSLAAAYRDTRRAHERLMRALTDWEQAFSVERKRRALRVRAGRHSGIRLVREAVSLDDEAKLLVASALADYFRRENIRSLQGRVVKGRPGTERPLFPEDAKRIAIHVAVVLEPHIGFSRPEIQRAINASNATYLSGIEPGTSATTKAGWGAAMVSEIRTDLSVAAERLALTLAQTYDVQLDEQAIELLHEQYGANPDRLRTLATTHEPDAELSVTYPQLQPQLEFGQRWHRTLQYARYALSRLED
jgi:hypothetical protein